jgi:hypothetical protein
VADDYLQRLVALEGKVAQLERERALLNIARSPGAQVNAFITGPSPVALGTINYDGPGIVNLASDRVEIPTLGVYLVMLQAGIPSASGVVQVFSALQGILLGVPVTAGSGIFRELVITPIVAGDELRIEHTLGGAATASVVLTVERLHDYPGGPP